MAGLDVDKAALEPFLVQTFSKASDFVDGLPPKQVNKFLDLLA